MTNARKIQFTIIAVAIALFVLLFIAPKTHTVNKTVEPKTANISPNATLDAFLNSVEKTLSLTEKSKYDSLIKIANQSTIDTAFISVVQFWDMRKRPDLASYFVEKTAIRKKNSSVAYTKAGDRYYYAIRFTKDDAEIPVLYESATRCYLKAIELIEAANASASDRLKISTYNEAKIQLAACYVEGSEDPMKGISLLREVEKTDSNNVKLQLNFAFFSVKSQQWDRAIKRFEKVLQIDPLFIEAYLHLADAYEQQGNKIKTIEMLEKYAKVTTDAMAKQEVLKYIEQLKK